MAFSKKSKNIIQGPLSGCQLLLVEDQLDNQELIQYHLKAAGASVHLAVDGVEALKMVNANRYDIVVMDLHMPRMDGYSATEYLRHKGLMIPIIALTANTMDESKKLASESGMTEYMLKPVDFPLLISTLEKYLSAKLKARRGLDLQA